MAVKLKNGVYSLTDRELQVINAAIVYTDKNCDFSSYEREHSDILIILENEGLTENDAHFLLDW